MKEAFIWADSKALLLLAVVGALTVAALIKARSLLSTLSLALRALVLALLVLALADPQRVTKIQGPARPVLVDLSDSITAQMRQWTADLLQKRLRLRADDPAIVFGGRSVVTSVKDAERELLKEGCSNCDSSRTSLEAALRTLVSQAGRAQGPVVLVTDGWENSGEATRVVRALNAAQSQLYIFSPPPPQSIPDVAVVAIDLPPALPNGGSFVLGVTILNSNREVVKGRLELSQDGRLVQTRQVELSPGLQRIDFPTQVKGSGLHSYRALFVPENYAQDAFRENDALDAWMGVGAQHKALILTEAARSAQYLAAVARQVGLEPEVVEARPDRSVGDLSAYDVVILDNVPRARLAATLRRSLISYVRRGGSLAMVGGDHSFGLGGYVGSELANVLPVLMKPPEHKQPQRALVLVIDKSGSMGRNNKLEYAKAAALAASRSLRDDDLFEVIGFDSQPFVVVPLEPLRSSRAYLEQMISRLRAQGTTYLLPALREAYRDLASSSASAKHVVILTDGKTGGTPDMYYDLVSSMHHEGGVTISTIAIGREPNVELLSAISRYGGGTFYQTDNPSSLPEITLRDVSRPSGELTMVEKEFRPVVLPADPVLGGFAGQTLPVVKGFVSTELRPGARLDAFVERAGKREPLVASWRFGAGKTLAVTTDASGRWSAEWLRQGVFGRLWQQMFDWMAPRVEATHPFSVELGYENGNLRVKLIDYSKDWEHSLHQMHATVVRPDGSLVQMPLSLDAAGEVRGEIEAPSPGVYRITFKSSAERGGLSVPPLAYSVSPSVLAEIPRPNPNYALLERLASATSGRFNPDLREISLTRSTLEKRVSARPFLLALAMLMMVVEAFTRRLLLGS